MTPFNILIDLDGVDTARITQTETGALTIVLMTPAGVDEQGHHIPAQSFTLYPQAAAALYTILSDYVEPPK